MSKTVTEEERLKKLTAKAEALLESKVTVVEIRGDYKASFTSPEGVSRFSIADSREVAILFLLEEWVEVSLGEAEGGSHE